MDLVEEEKAAGAHHGDLSISLKCCMVKWRPSIKVYDVDTRLVHQENLNAMGRLDEENASVLTQTIFVCPSLAA